ncbi:MAG: hypothetical protein K0R15_2767 [Clostridiales bacterium]|jgi:hypothetical protein|nr:hypothetical protein [Clostridiales bacterium]
MNDLENMENLEWLRSSHSFFLVMGSPLLGGGGILVHIY